MKIYLFTLICLDEDEYPDLIFYEHFIKHYENVGINVKHFHIIPCGTGTHKQNFNIFKKINRKYGIRNLNLVNKQHDMIECFNIFDTWRSGIDKNNWIVKCDPDELYDYGHFNGIYDCANYLLKNKFTAIRGEMLDCVDADRILKEVIPDEDIFSQFPLRSKITLHMLHQNHYKILMARPYIELIWGHHNTLCAMSGIHPKTFESGFFAFHFKWTNILIKRYDEQKRTEDEQMCPGFKDEVINQKNIITDGKLNFIIH